MTFWHKLLRRLALRSVKKLLRAAVLDMHILEDKAHLDLYSGEELDQTLERLLRRFHSVSAGLAALARDKYMGEDRYLNEIISTYCRAWCWIDVALRGEFADEVFAAHDWIELNTDSNASELRKIIRKKRYGQQTGDEE